MTDERVFSVSESEIKYLLGQTIDIVQLLGNRRRPFIEAREIAIIEGLKDIKIRHQIRTFSTHIEEP